MKFVLIIFSLLPALSFAKTAKEAKANCRAKENIAEAHEKWKTNLDRRLKAFDKDTIEVKYTVLKSSFETVLARTSMLRNKASIEISNPKLIEKAVELYDKMKDEKMKPADTIKELESISNSLSNNLDSMLRVAQELDTNCKILKTPSTGDKKVETKGPGAT